MKESNLPLGALLERLSLLALVDDQARSTASVVLARQSPQREELVVAHSSAHADPTFTETEHIVGEFRLVRERIGVGDIRRRLSQAAESGSYEVVNGCKIEINPNASCEFLPSRDPETGIGPRFQIQLTARTPARVGQTMSGPLVAFGQPSFESWEQAVRAWIPLRPFHGSSDGRLGSILIEVPLSGPRLGQLTLEGERSLKVHLIGISPAEPLELTGVWQSNQAESVEPFSRKILSDTVQVPRPAWAEQVAVWLVRSDSVVTDFFFENAAQCSRPRRVLSAPTAETDGEESAILAQIQSGEGEDLEFKPFLRPGNDKLSELIRTVIAFANKHGGTVYIGVSDHQEIEGVERELWKASPKGEKDERTNWYCAYLRKTIRDRVSKRIAFRVEAAHVAGKLLIVVEVEESKDKPCAEVSSNEIWTRRGANTVRPHPEELKRLMSIGTHSSGLFESIQRGDRL